MRRWCLVATAAAMALAGCQDPYEQDRGAPQTPPQVGDSPSPTSAPAPRTRPLDPMPAPAPRGAVDAFCAQWANWDWRTLGQQQRRLARLATGRLAAELSAEATVRKLDASLRRDRIGTEGTVAAIDVTPGTRERRAVCVARETSITNGRVDSSSTRHRVYLATVRHTEQGWGISAWEPQP